MNKLFIVFLAVCLVSVHAFVKRDAPAAGNNYMETLQKQMEEFAKTVNNQMSQAFDPDTIKKNFNELVDNATKTVHAFVKRDAPAAGGNNYMETLQKQMEEFAKTVNNQMSQAFDPDTIKKNFNELVDNATKTINQMKAAGQPKAA